MGVSRETFRDRVGYALEMQAKGKKGFTVPELPSKLRPVEELLDERERKFEQVNLAEEARRLINVRVNIDGPIGISHFGDPHVDDDGTNIGLLRRHIDIIKRTEGLFAGNIGDAMNNWAGRLVGLYAEQSTSAQEAWQLGEWFVRSVDWLYFLDGNHGCWSGSGDPVQWMLKHCNTVHENMGARLNLIFPNGREVRVNTAHDWPGHSMWHPTHGQLKAAKTRFRDHVFVAGHTHVSGYMTAFDEDTKLISHLLRVGAYKTHDRYGKQLNLPNQSYFENAVTIIDPYAKSERGLVHVCLDVEEGADYLAWKRQRA
jgi:hypothetical protein